MRTAPIQTERLKLVPKELEEVRAMVQAMNPAERAQLAPDWLERIQTATAADLWIHGFNLILRGAGQNIGTGGFKGPPSADGVVEIAYGIVADQQGKGYATEAAQALVHFAFKSEMVRVVRAHTLPETNASTHVLMKCGFRYGYGRRFGLAMGETERTRHLKEDRQFRYSLSEGESLCPSVPPFRREVALFSDFCPSICRVCLPG